MSFDNPEIGRILRAATTGFSLGCRATQLDIPFFGGLVKAKAQSNEYIYGLIYNFSVDDDPLVRRLVMADNLPPSAINDQRSNRMLPVEMSVLSVGYEHHGTIQQGFPPRPPLNLDQVFMVNEPDEVRRFTDKKSYLRLILRSADSGIPVDQLLVAHIRSIYELRDNDATWAMGVIQEVIELLRSNYETLIPTLEALSDALPTLSILVDG